MVTLGRLTSIWLHSGTKQVETLFFFCVVVWQLLAQAAGSLTHEQSYRKCCRNDVVEAYLQAPPRSAIHGAFPQRRHLLPFEPLLFFFFHQFPPLLFSSHDYAPSLPTSTHVTADSQGLLPTGHPPVTQRTSQHPAGTHLCKTALGKTAAETSTFQYCCTAAAAKKKKTCG